VAAGLASVFASKAPDTGPNATRTRTISAVEGLLVMADISGYTAFVAGTEQDHSQEILAELMEAISRSFGGKLTVDQVEGDALCCTTERTDVGVTDWLRETYRIFHRRLRDIRSATTCPCRACATVQDLGLKFVVHRGSFSRYEVAGRVQLHGNDVNLIHRLLKNTVPGREYLLATAAALSTWPESLREQFIAAPQRYDLGEVEASYLDLRPIRDAVWTEPAPSVDPETAKIRGTTRFPGTPEEVFRYFTDPKLRQIWMGVPRVDFQPGRVAHSWEPSTTASTARIRRRCSKSWAATLRPRSRCRSAFPSWAWCGERTASRRKGHRRRGSTPRSLGRPAASKGGCSTSWLRGCFAGTAASTTSASRR
jgi:class 3 adenylate cyclase